MTSYEIALDLVTETSSAASAGIRDITWLTAANVVGVARDHDGHLEVFLSGPRLEPASGTLKEAIAHHRWQREEGAPPLDANRILLPAVGHFDQVAAFICTELLRNGADANLSAAFVKTEPIVELAIERLRVSRAALIGLLGELLMLDALCRAAADDQVADIVASWDGWKRSSRDFSLGMTGVEVKTTTRSTSSHLVHGVHQVEPDSGDGTGHAEDRLILVSIGLQPATPDGEGFTIPMLVDRIVGRLEAVGRGDLTSEFLLHVAEYGSESGFGYTHPAMADESAFKAPVVTTFFRGYDMADPLIEVLRRDDITAHHHVDVGSVQFRVDLPVAVNGSLNPIAGANQVAKTILCAAAHPSRDGA